VSYYDKSGEPIDMDAWGKLHSDADYRVVGSDHFGGVQISTVWLGLDHGFNDDAQPVIFETMIFGGDFDEYQERYTTEARALAGHREALRLVKTGCSTVDFARRFQTFVKEKT
jgi:hypothetical protein